MKKATPLPTSPADLHYRQDLTRKIFAVLNGNGNNARPVYYGLESYPIGGLKELMETRLFDAVRAEMGGTTVTVEVTPERHGEQNEADQVCFACYDFRDFTVWFYSLLTKSGFRPRPDKPVKYENGPSRPTIRPSIINFKRKK